MLAFTHIAAGVAASLAVAQGLHAVPLQTLLILNGCILGSMMPDIDHPKSAFGSRMLPVSLPLSAIMGHRGITHSLLAVVGVTALCWWLFLKVGVHNGYFTPFIVGVAVGYLSHLAGDFFSNSGVPLLWPYKRKFVSPIKLCTGDVWEYVVAFTLYGLAFWLFDGMFLHHWS